MGLTEFPLGSGGEVVGGAPPRSRSVCFTLDIHARLQPQKLVRRDRDILCPNLVPPWPAPPFHDLSLRQTWDVCLLVSVTWHTHGSQSLTKPHKALRESPDVHDHKKRPPSVCGAAATSQSSVASRRAVSRASPVSDLCHIRCWCSWQAKAPHPTPNTQHP